MRVLIVDDEALARERLKRLLAMIQGVEIIGEAADGVQAVELIEQTQPDLVLLDIQMPRLDGFGVVESLEDPPLVVFVTAYDEYAIRAFEVNALDYLLKPVSRERLEQAIRRAEKIPRTKQVYAPLWQSLASQGQYLSRLAVRDREGSRQSIRVLDAGEVDWIGIEGDQVLVHAGDGTFAVRGTLTELETRLDPVRFFRASRFAIVNLERVKEIVPWFKGSYRLRLTTGAEVDLSRAQARALRKAIGW